MEFKDVEFKEGIHKSVRREMPREIENEPSSANEATAAPAKESPATSTPLPEPTSMPERERGRYGRGLQILALGLIVCIVGGGVLVFLKLHTTQSIVVKTLPKPTISLKHNLCPVQGAPFNANGPTSLSAVSALSASDVWTVGNSNYLPLVEHWDGHNWTIVPISTPNSATPRSQLGEHTQDTIDGVMAITSNDAWAVGQTVANGIGHALIEHWDGSQWSTADVLPDPSNFNSIAAVSSNDVWAVGQTVANGTSQALIMHWDGQNWGQMQLPNAFQRGALVSIAAVASNNLWVSEYHPNTVTSALGTNTMLHWDGQQWIPEPLPALNFGFILLGISALNAQDIWAVGTGTGTLLIEHWDGANWSIASNAQSPESFTTLSSVVAVSANDIWAVGGTNQLLVEHWDGKSWTLLAQPSTNGGLNSVATAGGKVWAVGSSQGASAPLIEASC